MLRGDPDIVAATVGVVPDGADSPIVTVHVPTESPVNPTTFPPPLAADELSPNVIVPPPEQKLFGVRLTL